MALDVFHQVLAKLLEAAGGSPRQMVPVVDVVKRERLFGSIDMIVERLHSEGWIADAPKRDHVFVTTWGIEEVRRTAPPAPAPAPEAPGPAVVPAEAPASAQTSAPPKGAEPKNAAALRAAAAKARELAGTLEELAAVAGGTAAQRKAKARKALAAVSAAVDEAFE